MVPEGAAETLRRSGPEPVAQSRCARYFRHAQVWGQGGGGFTPPHPRGIFLDR